MAELRSRLILSSPKHSCTWGISRHDFHNFPEFRLKTALNEPTVAVDKHDIEVHNAYLNELESWKMKDLHARGVVLGKLDSIPRPNPNSNFAVPQIYTMVTDTHKISATILCRKSYKKLINTKFITNATDYRSEFQKNLSNFCKAVVNLQSTMRIHR